MLLLTVLTVFLLAVSERRADNRQLSTKQKVISEDWILVFRGQSGNSIKISSVYNATQTSDAHMDSLSLSTISKFGDNTSAHYTSRWLNLWPANITQVKVELYERGVTVLSMLFNGTGSNSTNWFSHSRLLQSPFTDLASPPVTFSFTSFMDKGRFVVGNGSSFSNCYQTAWLFVVDAVSSLCPWHAKTNGPFVPRILYSKGTTLTWLNTSALGEADVLAVFIKF